MKKNYLTLFFLLLYSSLFSQWSVNPAVNTTVCDTSGEQALPKISAILNGGCYAAWFDSRAGSYAVYLQKLDQNGYKQFPGNGILISSNPQNTSLVDWDMITDDQGNAVIVFTDIRNGGLNPFAYKVSPSGNFLWGAIGVSLTDSSSIYQPNPKVTQTSDGNFVVLWIYASTPRKIAMQKLNADGIPQWGSHPVKLSGSLNENFDWPSLVATNGGGIIVYWCGYTGSFLNPQNYRLYTQKFNSFGVPVWNSTQDTVYSLGRVSGFYTPRIFPDGSKGAIFCWRDDRDANNIQDAYVQRVDSSGNFRFPVNGSQCSNNGSNNHFDPVASNVLSSGETFAFWMEANAGQTQSGGLYGQRFSPNGTRLWVDAGKEFKPMNNNVFSGLSVFVKDTSAVIAYNEAQFGSANSLIRALKTGPSGNLQWSGSIITPGSIPSEKLRMAGIIDPASGMTILSWSDRRNDAGGIYAQNINSNGSFGIITGIETEYGILPGDFHLFQNYPNPFNSESVIKIQVPNTAKLRLALYDILGREINELINREFPPGIYSIRVDGTNLPSGIYFYRLEAGYFSDTKKIVLIK